MTPSRPPALEESVRIDAGGVALAGDLMVPPDPVGVVIFAHGSGSSRFSSRNRAVAEALRQSGIGTLLLDLLTPSEEAEDQHTGHLRFDIGLLATRLTGAHAWIEDQGATARLPIGYFGASTGGGAALVAAADRPGIRAVVSRGGRPDLAGPALARVRAPTLLLVGGRDQQVLELNRAAMARMRCEVELSVVPGATHLFEEPGALEEVARLAGQWFVRHFVQ